VYRSGVISSLLSRASAALLLVGGIGLLFAPDVLLPRLLPGFPTAAAWLGQWLGAAWLAMALLNWMLRTVLMGGIYGRPIVMANLVLYVISALSLFRVLWSGRATQGLWFVLAPTAVFAVAYGALLLRGPFDPFQPPANSSNVAALPRP
jgi:hypothetical protein